MSESYETTLPDVSPYAPDPSGFAGLDWMQLFDYGGENANVNAINPQANPMAYEDINQFTDAAYENAMRNLRPELETQDERFSTAAANRSLLAANLRRKKRKQVVDKVAATESIFGALIASGFQTIALTFRLFRDTGVLTGTNLGGHGMDEVRWLAPVYSGDTIRACVTVEAITPSRSKPDRGTVRFRYRSYNQDDVEVLSLTMDHVMARRKTGERPSGHSG